MSLDTSTIDELVSFAGVKAGIDGTTPLSSTNLDLSGVGLGRRYVAIAHLTTPDATNTLKWEQSPNGTDTWTDIPGTETGESASFLVSTCYGASQPFIRATVTRPVSSAITFLLHGTYLQGNLPASQASLSSAIGAG